MRLAEGVHLGDAAHLLASGMRRLEADGLLQLLLCEQLGIARASVVDGLLLILVLVVQRVARRLATVG